MSFEGYYQYMCPNGHYGERDCYEDEFGDEWKCSYCQAPAAWWNLVDVTNGSFGEYYDEDDKIQHGRIDGFVDVEVDQPAPMCECSTCGHKHATGPATYKIPPEGEGHHSPKPKPEWADYVGHCGVPDGWVWDEESQDYIPPDEGSTK